MKTFQEDHPVLNAAGNAAGIYAIFQFFKLIPAIIIFLIVLTGVIMAASGIDYCWEAITGEKLILVPATDTQAEQGEDAPKTASTVPVLPPVIKHLPVDHMERDSFVSEHLFKGAKAGNASFMFTLGQGYLLRTWDMNGVKKQDYIQKGSRWLTEASNRGHMRARYELGECYWKQGDKQKAKELWLMVPPNGPGSHHAEQKLREHFPEIFN